MARGWREGGESGKPSEGRGGGAQPSLNFLLYFSSAKNSAMILFCAKNRPCINCAAEAPTVASRAGAAEGAGRDGVWGRQGGRGVGVWDSRGVWVWAAHVLEALGVVCGEHLDVHEPVGPFVTRHVQHRADLADLAAHVRLEGGVEVRVGLWAW